MDKMYVIPEVLLVGIQEYLSTRPYREVAQAMQALSGLLEFRPSDEPKPEIEKSAS